MEEERFCWDGNVEYEKFIQHMNPPTVVLDNESSPNATLIRVDGANRHGILLEIIQVIVDQNLNVLKAYVSSDGGWFMDVFHVTDRDGNKIVEETTLNAMSDYMRKSLGADSSFLPSKSRSIGFIPSSDYTSIELTGTDRPGLLSEVFAVFTDLKCNIVNAEAWTHNARAAAVMQVTDEVTGLPITDSDRLAKIKQLLCHVLKGNNKTRAAKMAVSMSSTHRERRLHQMMLNDRDYERSDQNNEKENGRPNVTIVDWLDMDYSVVTIRCKDRPKLLFDVVCTLTDMEYLILHGNAATEGQEAMQEFWIRHIDGSPVNSEAERQRVVQCLEAAIERRVSEGIKLELCTDDRVGLLSDLTRIFRENGLNVQRAEVDTRGGKAINTFYISGISGNSVDSSTLDAIRDKIGQSILQVKGHADQSEISSEVPPIRFLFGGLFKSRSFSNLGLLKSC